MTTKTLMHLALTGASLIAALTLQAQQYFGMPKHMQCGHEGCKGLIGTGIQHDSFIPPPESFSPGQPRDVIINVDYNGFTPAAQTAFQYAVDIWASLLTSDVPIQLEANWESIGGGTLGFAGAEGFFINFAGNPDPNTYYPAALADKIAGFDLDPGSYDISATFNSTTNWYFGLDGNPGFGQYDFVTVVLHELGHGLGVIGSATVDNGVGFWLFDPLPSIYDSFIENGQNTPIFSFGDGTFALGNQLTGEDLFWNGPVAVGNNSGVEPSIFAPDTWNGGSSYSHLDESTYSPGNPNSLMTPFLAPGEANHDPGPIILGLMEDIGWTVEEEEDCTQALHILTITPDCFGSEVTWEVRNSANQIVASGGPYVDVFPEDIQTYFEEICLGEGCFTFTIFDAFGDGLAGTEEGSCGVDGDFFITNPGGDIVVEMGAANYGDQASFDFCVEETGCGNLDMSFTELPCTDNGFGDLVPQVEVLFNFTGNCTVEDICASADGAAPECINLPGLQTPIILASGETVNLTLDPNVNYSFSFTLSDGSTSGTFNYSSGNCSSDELVCDCAGTQHTLGVLDWLGDGFEDDGSFNWEGQPVDFNCATWGFDCGDIGPIDDPFGVCNGNLPPNNGCGVSACGPLGLTLSQEPCIDTGDGFGILPVIGFDFDIAGDCVVSELCVQVNGEGFDCFNLIDLDILADNDNGIIFTNTTAEATYEFYYVTEDGTTSPTFTWQNGNCDNEPQICDCAGTQHSIGVLSWIGDGFADDGSFDWDGQPVDFNCDTWGFDCGDIGGGADPFGVCDGNLPPNNGCVGEIAGCTDPQASNYNPDATIDDGSCVYDVPGCTNPEACNFNEDATVDDGSCEFVSCAGCTNQNACNFDPTATIDDGSCDFSCLGCTDPGACNFDPTATIDDGSCDFSCQGCTDPTACNYNPNATDDDGSCEFLSCAGCTDETACNFDPNATIDDGSCEFVSCLGCTDPTACNFDPNATIDDASCEFESCLGCTDVGACNFDPDATIDDGSCDYSCLGCTDPEACNYDDSATIDDGSCDFSCLGCTDPEACNYNPDATVDDGSCEFVSCAGCTDPTALNYDPEATIDDGSCIFECILPTVSVVESGCADGDNQFFIEVNCTNIGNGAPYLITNNTNGNATVLSQTGTIQYGPFTEGSIVDVSITSQSLDECSITFPGIDCPVGVNEQELNLARVYPNPASTTLTLEGKLPAKTEVRMINAIGQTVLSTEWNSDQQTMRLDVAEFSSGVYMITLRDGERMVHHRVIVQH